MWVSWCLTSRPILPLRHRALTTCNDICAVNTQGVNPHEKTNPSIYKETNGTDPPPPPSPNRIARFMRPTWGPSGADRSQVHPMLAPWTLLSGKLSLKLFVCQCLWRIRADGWRYCFADVCWRKTKLFIRWTHSLFLWCNFRKFTIH